MEIARLDIEGIRFKGMNMGCARDAHANLLTVKERVLFFFLTKQAQCFNMLWLWVRYKFLMLARNYFAKVNTVP